MQNVIIDIRAKPLQLTRNRTPMYNTILCSVPDRFYKGHIKQEVVVGRFRFPCVSSLSPS